MPDQPNPSDASAVDAAAQTLVDTHTRRDFLKASAAVGGASLLGGCLTETYDPKKKP